MHIVLSDKPVKFYNLDVIISLGYRVNSARSTQFRIWATNVLKQYLIEGYTLNEKRLKEQTSKFHALQMAVKLIGSMKDRKQLEYKEAIGLLEIISDYNYALDFLDDYDYKRIAASIFLWFLEKNGILHKEDGSKRIQRLCRNINFSM